MPIIKSAIKRAKQTIKRRERNNVTRRSIKSSIKAFIAKPTAATLSEAQSAIDTAVKKNILEKNTAARRKSNLAKIAKNANVKLVSATKPAVTKKPTAAKKPVTTKTVKKATPATKKPAAKKTVAKSAVRRTATKK